MRTSTRFASILIGSTLLLSACIKRKSTQGAAKPLESFNTLYADQLSFDETSRDVIRSSPLEDASDIQKNTPSSTTQNVSKRALRSQMHETQARLVDIPIPLQSTPLERYFYAQNGVVTLGYDVRGYVSDYMLFYEQGLERSGWCKVALSATPFETVLIYDKPERFCLVSLRHVCSDGSVPIRIIIHMGTKETFAYAS